MLITLYQCPICKHRLLNHTQQAIDAHRIKHGKQPTKEPKPSLASPNPGRKKKKKRGHIKQLNRKINELQNQLNAIRTQLKKKKQGPNYTPHPFYDSDPWRRLKYQVLNTYPRVCMCCRKTEGEMHVDHIKPRSKYPDFELDFNNLQILCKDCNLGKSNLDETDYRPHS